MRNDPPKQRTFKIKDDKGSMTLWYEISFLYNIHWKKRLLLSVHENFEQFLLGMDRYCARSFMNKIYFVYNESLKINAQRVVEPGNVLSKPHLKRAPDVRLKLCICVSIFNLSLDNNNDLRYVINAVQHTMTINLILIYIFFIVLIYSWDWAVN